MLAGPIEYWWDTPEDPDRFESAEAIEFRAHRETVSEFLVHNGYLCYRPWNAFKGPWNEDAQSINDWVVDIAHVIVNLNPGVPASGTDREVGRARRQGKPVVECPPGTDLHEFLHLLNTVVRDYLAGKYETNEHSSGSNDWAGSHSRCPTCTG